MSRLASASAEDFHSSTKISFIGLSQRYSEDQLILSNRAQAARGPRRRRRTNRSPQLFNGGLPSPPTSESDEADTLTSATQSKQYRFSHGLSSTQVSHVETTKSISSFQYDCTPNPGFQTCSTLGPLPSPCTPLQTTKHARQDDTLPFPLDASLVCIPGLNAGHDRGNRRKLKRRCVSAEARFLTPPTSPDRYISSRYSPQPQSSTFRTSKSPQQLSDTERLLRQNSATPDPFRSPTRLREGRRAISGNDRTREIRSTSHSTSGPNFLGLPQSTIAVQNRQASAGTVWNVGGNTTASLTGPMQGIPDGRGGLIGSGTNAPMYTSRFLEGETPDQDLERLEGRLAAALEIDQTRRMLDFPGSPQRERYAGSGSAVSTPKYLFTDSRTRWKDGAWVQEGTPSRE